MTAVALFVSAPVASFRVPQAREYLETLPCPPPSTVYGMVLSLVGEVDRRVHAGAELALALLSRPAVSTVLRTAWRVKDLKTPPGSGENKRPDYQELLTGLRLAVWVRPGTTERATPALAERVAQVLAGESPQRFGGLSLGESTHLVDELRALREGDMLGPIQLLRRDDRGDLALPIWPDHVGSRGTHWGQYRLTDVAAGDAPPDDAWTPIVPPLA